MTSSLTPNRTILFNHHSVRGWRFSLGLNQVVCATIRLWAPGATWFAKVLCHLLYLALGSCTAWLSPGYFYTIVLQTHTINPTFPCLHGSELEASPSQGTPMCRPMLHMCRQYSTQSTNTVPLGFQILARESMDPITLGCYAHTSPMIIVRLCPWLIEGFRTRVS